ncbi:MAG: phosphoribosyltransferase domain-containing protein, partial [Deltaproteobacteria bacterium]|nr:phosphoribosyltransferase domain-containing protein [Deltaproteobacteria bacterium]
DALALPLKDFIPQHLQALRASSTTSWTFLSEKEVIEPAAPSDRVERSETNENDDLDAISEPLVNGRVAIRGLGEGWPTRRLLGVAARVLSSRPFLLVSKVLGKHLPVTPYRMLTTHRALATRLASDLPGPVLFVGLAETATGLGWGVFEQWLAATGRTDGVYIHTTRYTDSQHHWLGFDEVHSHAPLQAVCAPESATSAAECRRARTVVVVDDEITTGRTARELVTALRNSGVPIEQFVAVGLVGAFPDSVVSEGGALHGWSVHVLGRVSIDFEKTTVGTGAPAVSQGLTRLSTGAGAQLWGRYGAKLPPRLPEAVLARALDATRRAQLLTIVAAGECMYPAFVLGRALETAGHTVLLQSTSRSPVAFGGDIRSSLECADSLGSGVRFFIHNPPTPGSGNIVIHEPGAECGVAALATRLGGTALEVWDA